MKMGKTDAKGNNAKVAASSLIRISNRTNLRWQQRACQIRSWPSRAENLPVLGAKSRNSSSQIASWGLCVCIYARMSGSVCAITAACKLSSSPLITAARLFPACPPSWCHSPTKWEVTIKTFSLGAPNQDVLARLAECCSPQGQSERGERPQKLSDLPPGHRIGGQSDDGCLQAQHQWVRQSNTTS